MWSDRDTEHDCLGFTSYVNVLADVCTLPDLAPLTVGVFGAWGSGKTSLMRMIKAKIDTMTELRTIKTLWFNAWRYEGREEAQSALIHAVLAKLEENRTLGDDVKKVFKRLKDGASVLKLAKFIGQTAMTMTPNLGEFIDCFRDESEKIAETMERFHADFEEALRLVEVDHIVVFIDDLDRCSSDKVIETFETIKLFLNTPACTFVIGADAARIEEAVGEVFRVTDQQRRKDYLEKIVQVPFVIPGQDLHDIACYVGMLVLLRHIDPGGVNELLDARPSFYGCGTGINDALRQWPTDHGILFPERVAAAREELDGILPYVRTLASGLRGNPRQIKRFLNILALRRRLAEANRLDVEPEFVVKLGVLEYVWADFFAAIVDTVDPESGQSALIDETLKAAEAMDTQAGGSKLVRESLRQAGLVDYLLAEPAVNGAMNLRPYLFLAQTSLSRSRPAALVPVDEKARSLARAIESDDPLRNKTAARQAAAQEASVVSAVVRTLLTDLPGAKEAIVQTHILNGLSTICQSHRDQFPAVLKALAQFDPGTKTAVALAAGTLLASAEAAGQLVDAALRDRLTAGSGIAKALSGGKGRKSSRR